MANPQLTEGTVAQLGVASAEADSLVSAIDRLRSSNVASVEAELEAMRAIVATIDASLVRAIDAR